MRAKDLREGFRVTAMTEAKSISELSRFLREADEPES